MSRSASPSKGISTYEMYNQQQNQEADLLISKLKAEIFDREQSEKNMNLLQGRFRSLQNDLNLLSNDILVF